MSMGINEELERLGISETPPTPEQVLDMITPIVKECVDQIKKITPNISMNIYINTPQQEYKDLPYLIEIDLDSLKTNIDVFSKDEFKDIMNEADKPHDNSKYNKIFKKPE